ncbi:MAG: hypothetical protein ACK5LS_10020, partial [Propioniciclava sp.]
AGVGVPEPMTEELWDTLVRNDPDCHPVAGGVPDFCVWVPPAPGAPFVPRPGDRVVVESFVRRATHSLALPEPDIQIGPAPSRNKWKMAVVGLPYWVWSEEDGALTTSVTTDGITITLAAVRDNVVFDFGDGTTTTCARMTRWTSFNYDPGDESPTCGHVFTYPSHPGPDYTITATANWTFTWSALGYSGTLPGTTTGTRDVPVTELQALNVPVRR